MVVSGIGPPRRGLVSLRGGAYRIGRCGGVGEIGRLVRRRPAARTWRGGRRPHERWRVGWVEVRARWTTAADGPRSRYLVARSFDLCEVLGGSRSSDVVCGASRSIRSSGGYGIGSTARRGVFAPVRPPDRRRSGGDGGWRTIGGNGAPDRDRLIDGIGSTTCGLEVRVATRGWSTCGCGELRCRDSDPAGRGHVNRCARHRRARSDHTPGPGRLLVLPGPWSRHRLRLGLGRCFRCEHSGRQDGRCRGMIDPVADDEPFGGGDGRFQFADRPGSIGNEPLQGGYHRAQLTCVDPRRLTHDVSRLSSSGLAAVRRPAPTS